MSASIAPVQSSGSMNETCAVLLLASSKSSVPCCVLLPVRQLAVGALDAGRSKDEAAVVIAQPAAAKYEYTGKVSAMPGFPETPSGLLMLKFAVPVSERAAPVPEPVRAHRPLATLSPRA